MTKNCMKCGLYPCTQVDTLHKFMKENSIDLRIVIHGCRKDPEVKMSDDGSVNDNYSDLGL